MQPEFVTYQQRIIENARTLASELEKLGFRIVTGGTDNHLLLVDLRPMGITGKQAEEALDSIGICANRNAIPFDTLPASSASGLRLGTPAVTTRGLGPDEMVQIAMIIYKILTNLGDEKVKSQAAEDVEEISGRFPVP